MACRGKFIWSRELTLNLIAMYEQHPLLYNIKSADYKNKIKRNEALEEIRDSLCSKSSFASNQCLSLEDIKNKIHILRTQFFKEYRNLKESKVSGAGTEEIYVPKLWCFQDLKFLIEGDVVSNSISNIENEICEKVENEEENMATRQDTILFDGNIEELMAAELTEVSHPSTPAVPGPSSSNTPQKQKLHGNISRLIENATIALKDHRASKGTSDDFHSFANSVSDEMRKIKKPKNIRILKRKIFNLIIDMQEEEAEEEL